MLLTKSCFNPALRRSDLRRCWPLLAPLGRLYLPVVFDFAPADVE